MSQKQKILLVDDDQDVLDFLQMLLAVEGLSTVQASEAGTALQALSDDEVGLVLLDVAMPGVDGLQLCRQIKASSKTKDLPVMVLSARPGQGVEDEAMAAGAENFVRKPFDNDQLLSLIRARLGSARA
jgi:DNA-binding response OmpR family regulator